MNTAQAAILALYYREKSALFHNCLNSIALQFTSHEKALAFHCPNEMNVFIKKIQNNIQNVIILSLFDYLRCNDYFGEHDAEITYKLSYVLANTDKVFSEKDFIFKQYGTELFTSEEIKSKIDALYNYEFKINTGVKVQMFFGPEIIIKHCPDLVSKYFNAVINDYEFKNIIYNQINENIEQNLFPMLYNATMEFSENNALLHSWNILDKHYLHLVWYLPNHDNNDYLNILSKLSNFFSMEKIIDYLFQDEHNNIIKSF